MERAQRFGHVVMLGPTNAGKSTLLNRVIGQKVSIVSPKPQTTRNSISGILTEGDAQAVFLDTPGLHRQKRGIAPLLLRSAYAALGQADVVLVLLDGARYARDPDALRADLRPVVQALTNAKTPVVVALNKSDAVRDKARMLPVLAAIGEALPGAELFPVSALTGQGVAELLTALFARLPEGPHQYDPDEISTAPVRFLAGEIVREKLFLALGEELPYSTAVTVENWDEKSKPGLVKILATILVGRESHKPMVIGKGGERIKDIGAKARAEIEEMIGSQVFLELWVKVRPDWAADQGLLRELGLGE
ncbi:GTP-binding protein Era [Solidesulfovibrio fructosivorans JJ]]|uniref:GTPase Era n=1 Tax=Solidesulfovibrio fructosivorans JJ] TaxID=596151 RepID=E1JV96_SOLFR|nr:GTPase Era [Solidesulfovibrio fructosivorans]EFL51690.1 GTP-binding protein Era [Solidesulfovibrio fructosivorans JJ]]